MKGIAVVKPGVRLGAIGAAIQAHAEANRFSVVRDFCGHGVGKVFHDAPSVLHYGRASDGPILREGMIFTIEPMINAGRYEVKILGDGWTAVTKDRSLVGAVRAFHRRHFRRLRDLHPVARGLYPAALHDLTSGSPTEGASGDGGRHAALPRPSRTAP